MIPYLYGLLASHIAVFCLFAPPLMAKSTPGPSASAEVSRNFLPIEKDQPETALLYRRYTGSLVAPIPVAIFSGMFVLVGDVIRNERIYQTSKKSSYISPLEGSFPPAPPDQPLASIGTRFIPHHQEGAPLFEVEVRRWNRVRQPEFVPPLWDLTFHSDIASKDLSFPTTFSPRYQATLSLGARYQRFGSAQRLIPILGYRTRHLSGWELDIKAPYHLLWSLDTPRENWRFYAAVRWDPRSDPYVIPANQDHGRLSGWTWGWTNTALIGTRYALSPPLYLALEGGIQKEDFQAYTEKGQELKSLRTNWGPWARLALETWIKTP